jgi:hypothetical protein
MTIVEIALPMEDRIVQHSCFEFWCGQLTLGRFEYSQVIGDWSTVIIIILVE